MRKILSIFLIFCICISLALPVVYSAETGSSFNVDKKRITTIQAEDAFAHHKGISMVGTYASVNRDEWLDVKIDVSEEGEYLVKAIIATTAGFDITVSVDGNAVLKSRVKATTSYTDFQPSSLGVIELTKGEHTLRFHMGEGGMHFDYITLEEYVYVSEDDVPVSFAAKTGPYKNIYIPAKIEAEDYDRGDLGSKTLDGINEGEKYRPNDPVDIYGNDKLGYYTALFENEKTMYTFNVENEGVFSLSVVKGAGSFDVFFDNKPTPIKIITNGSSQNLKEYFVANIFLTKGVHTVTFEATEPDSRLDSFSLLKSEGIYYTLEDFEGELPEIAVPETEKAHSVYKSLYVAPNGSDENDGSKGKPFATIKRAKEEVAKINDNMTGDIIVWIASGEYRLYETEVFGVEHGGKNGYDVIFKGENAFSPPVIHGGKKVEGWEKYNDYLWKAPLETEGGRKLYINGYPATRSKSKYCNVVTGDYVIPESGLKRNGILLSKKNFPGSFSNPSEMEFVSNTFWISNRFPIKNIIYREDDVAIEMDNAEYFDCYLAQSAHTALKSGRAFYLENAFEFLDEPGEFYYNREEKMIYYYPYQAEDMTKAETFVDETEYLLKVQGENSSKKVCNITFDNIDLRYGACFEYGKTGMWTRQADQSHNAEGVTNPPSMMPSQVTVNYADNVNILNCRMSCLGSAAIGLYESVTNSEVTGNIIRDISGTAVIVGHFDHTDTVDDSERCQYIDITNNVIHRVADEYLQCAALAIYYEKFINVCHNDFLDCPYSAATIGWGWSTISPAGNINFSYNRIENPMVNLDDGGAVYTLGPLRQTNISYNYIVNNQGDYGGALYTDSGSSYLKLHHNVIGKTTQLWAQGQYMTSYMELYDCYSNTAKYTEREKTNSTGTIFRDVTVVTDGNWPKEAVEIMENAGLMPEYEKLLKFSELPHWKVAPIYTVPEGTFVSSSGSEYIQAEDFLEGGEGVGYHKIEEVPDNNSYRSDGVVLMAHPSEAGYVISTNFPSEWLAYEAEIEKDGVYSFELKGSHAWAKEEPQPAVNVFIDDELVFKHEPTAVSDNWYNIKTKILGTVEMTEGKHHIRIEILENGFYMDAFRFVSEDEEIILDELGNDFDYDEGKYVSEADFLSKGAKVEIEEIATFSDIGGHWAAQNIIRAAGDGIVKGFPDGSFRPDEGVTLEQTVLMAYRALNIEPKSSVLEDARERAIYSDDSALSKELIREEFAEVVMKIYMIKHRQFPYVYSHGLFTDEYEITQERLVYVYGAKGSKLMNGDENGAFRPRDKVTRAEAATVLERI